MAIQSAEHAMSQFDSRVAMVGLGRSNVQVLRLGQTRGGTYSVNPGTGWLRITHTNYSGSGNTEVIANITRLGEVVYRNGGTTIAYQGGGVWRLDNGGGATMISPPEFHYRGATLTLPILNVSGSGSVAGSTTAVLSQTVAHRRIFPNSSATYDTAPSQEYRNPIGNGTVNITVKSDYFRAWETYFRTRTDGNVSVDPANETVTIQLIALATQGDFSMPLEGNSVTFRGLTGHQIKKFTITLFDDDDDNAGFSNFKWSLAADEGSKQFEIHLEDASSGADDGEPARIIIYYSDDNGNHYQTWSSDTVFHYETESATGNNFNGDDDYSDKRLVVNLTATKELTYQDAKPMTFSTSGESFNTSTTFKGHPSDTGQTYNTGNNNTIDNITNHYLALMGPTVSLRVVDKSSDTINERISSGT
ncbi:MAG: hypothetical protein ABEI52_08485, partial [Halobacteriaceae archaeon]